MVGGQIFCRGPVWVWRPNLSVALLSRAQELPFIIFDLLELIKLIALYGDIPSSSSWAKGKSGQIKQSIKQARFWLYDVRCPAGSGREKDLYLNKNFVQKDVWIQK